MDWPSIILSLVLTAVAYMVFPLIRLLINGGRFAKNRAHKIALWNSIVLGAFFCITTIAVSEDGTIWNGAPAVLYYWINRAILTDKDVEDEVPSKSQIEKSKKRKNVTIKILKGVGAFILGIISSEMLLMIILGDSVEGTTALLLMFLVAIPFFALYFWLFIRNDKKKAEKSYVPVFEEVPSRPVTNTYATRPPQISYADEKLKAHGNYNISGSDIVLETKPLQIAYCRKCGNKLMPDSVFCNMCGTQVLKGNEE